MSVAEQVPYSIAAEEGVIHLTFKDDLVIDDIITRELIERVNELSDGDARLFIEHGVNNEITFKGQKCLSQAEGVSKIALFLNHTKYIPVFRHLIHISAFFNRKYQMKIVQDLQEARRWLLS